MTDRYSGERYSPKVPACGKSSVSLYFDGLTLHGRGTKNIIYIPAVSGRSEGGKFGYSLERQKIPDRGPIPAGDYWIQPSELRENAWYRLQNSHTAWGDFWITIHPYPHTETYKRGGFFIHGGSTPGSAGCIDLSSNMNRFVAALRNEFKGKSMCYIPLTVWYSK